MPGSRLSPAPGRVEWERTADELLDGVIAFRSSSGARFDLPGPRPSASGDHIDGLEGYARTFWLAACRSAHAPSSRREEIVGRYLPGLVTGPRGGDGGWPEPADHPQTMVEAGSIAFALFETREQLWATLSRGERERLAEYLLRAVQRDVGGNWLFFRILVHSTLRRLGIAIPYAQTRDDLIEIDRCHRGDGWYSDGIGVNGVKVDYYNAWSFHLYPALWARIEGAESDPGLVARFAARDHQATESLLHMIGGDGAPVYQGRSLTYRAAMTAAFPASALIGNPPDGRHRRAAGRALSWFLAHGAQSSGRLSLGWRDEFPAMAQGYSGPASPYWMSKAFVSLLLPRENSYWTLPEQPIPVEMEDFVRAEPAVGWMLSGSRGGGIIRLVNHGAVRTRALRDPHSMSIRDDPNYARLAYSTATAPVLDERTLERPDPLSARFPDNSLTVLTRRGMPRLRESTEVHGCGHSWIASRFLLVDPEQDEPPIAVEVRSILSRGAELRLFRLDAPGRHDVIATGYPVADPLRTDRTDTTLAVVSTRLRSTVRRLGGHSAEASAGMFADESGPTAFGGRTMTPGIRFEGVTDRAWSAFACRLDGLIG